MEAQAAYDVTEDNMCLPPGKTCADCAHYGAKCSWLLGLTGHETRCDFSPDHFVSVDERMGDEDFENLKQEIVRIMDRLDRLQKLYRDQVGQDYRPFR